VAWVSLFGLLSPFLFPELQAFHLIQVPVVGVLCFQSPIPIRPPQGFPKIVHAGSRIFHIMAPENIRTILRAYEVYNRFQWRDKSIAVFQELDHQHEIKTYNNTPQAQFQQERMYPDFSDYHSIPQMTSLGLTTLIWNVPFGSKHGILSPDFGWKQGILFRWIFFLCELPGAGLVGDILKMSCSLLLKKSLNLSNL